jgi:trehalose 6-phosphate synthase/phosphatase
MITTPSTYPIWKTKRPLVVVDSGDDEGMCHRYRYVAVTPGSNIDWTNVKRDDEDSSRRTSAITPEGSEDEMEVEEGTMAAEEDPVVCFDYPPVLFENPDAPRETMEGEKGHKRHHSLFDSQGNPVVLPGMHDDEGESSAPVSTNSFSSYTTERPSVVLTWEAVNALPYRTRALTDSDQIDIVDTWNNGDDPSYEMCWRTRRIESSSPLPESLPMEEDVPSSSDRESIYIVCYHLPVILTKSDDEWTACWSESLIAKSEIQSVSSTRKTVWIGTVSNIPAEYLSDPEEQEAIRRVLQSMDCIPVFFTDPQYESVIEFMYLGFCKQVLWPSFHNVDLLDLATNGWGQRQRSTGKDVVEACALAAAEARERKRSGSLGGGSPGGGMGGEKLRSDWDQVRSLGVYCQVFLFLNGKKLE